MFTVPINEIANQVQMQWNAGLTPMIWGPPGIGKSECIHALAAKGKSVIPKNDVLSHYSTYLRDYYGQTFNRRKLFDVRLLLLNPTDLSGIPVYNKDDREASWVQTGLFPMASNILAELERRLASKFAEIEAMGWKPEPVEVTEARILDRMERGLGEETPEARMVREIQSVSKLADNERSRLAATWDQIMHLEGRIASGLLDQHSIVFLDEISIASKMVQGAALQLVLDRSCGTYRLPDGVGLVAAGNRVSDGVGAKPMSPALATRFDHIQAAEPTFESWEPWAIENGIDPVVIGFLNFRRDALFNFDVRKLMSTGSESAVTFPTPRTWTMVSRFIQKNGGLRHLYGSNETKRITRSSLSGLVGEDQVNELNAFIEIYRFLPDPNEVLDGRLKKIDYKGVLTKEDQASEMIYGPKVASLKYAFVTNLITIINNEIRDLYEAKQGGKPEFATLSNKVYPRIDALSKFLLADEDDVEWANVFYFKVLQVSMMMLDAKKLHSMDSFRDLISKAGEAEAHNGRPISGKRK